MTITNKKDARIWEIFLRDGIGNTAFIPEIKAALRAYYHRPLPESRCIYWDDYGYAVTLGPLPVWISDAEEAEDYFESVMRMDYVPSQYDCTGQTFTRWHKIVLRRGRWWCYHGTAMDI